MGAYNRRNTRARRQGWSYFGPVHWGGAGEGGEDMLHTRRMMFAGTVSAIALGMAAPAYAQDTTGAATANQGEAPNEIRSEEHTSELKSLMRISHAVICLNKKKHNQTKK